MTSTNLTGWQRRRLRGGPAHRRGGPVNARTAGQVTDMSDLNDGCITAAGVPSVHRRRRDSIAHDAVVTPMSLSGTDIKILGKGYADLTAEVAALRLAVARAVEDLSATITPVRAVPLVDRALGDLRRALECHPMAVRDTDAEVSR